MLEEVSLPTATTHFGDNLYTPGETSQVSSGVLYDGSHVASLLAMPGDLLHFHRIFAGGPVTNEIPGQAGDDRMANRG